MTLPAWVHIVNHASFKTNSNYDCTQELPLALFLCSSTEFQNLVYDILYIHILGQVQPKWSSVSYVLSTYFNFLMTFIRAQLKVLIMLLLYFLVFAIKIMGLLLDPHYLHIAQEFRRVCFKFQNSSSILVY